MQTQRFYKYFRSITLHHIIKNLMKIHIIIFFISFSFFTCSEDEVLIKDQIVGSWELVSISGGLGGFNCEYKAGEIIWLFDANAIKVEKNTVFSTNCDNKQSGSYSYTIVTDDDTNFLFFNSADIGQVSVITSDEVENLTINGNELSTGSGADGFLYTFRRI